MRKPEMPEIRDWPAAAALWAPAAESDNAADLARLRRGLRAARQQDLTPRQQQMLELYYDQGLTNGEIARRLEVAPSTVSRTLQRARGRLYRSLRHCL